MSAEDKYRGILQRFFPEKFVEDAFILLKENEVHLKITKTRHTKLGDYRSPFNGKGHRISINGELNSQEFLITFLHEFAHLNTNIKFGNKVKPHGKEWKQEFKYLLQGSLGRNIFPPEVETTISKIVASKRGFSTNMIDDLRLKLSKLSAKPKIMVKDLEPDSVFTLKSGRDFKLGEKRRKRFRCIEIETGRIYSVHPMAEVVGVRKA